MHEIVVTNAAAYLREQGWIDAAPVTVTRLAGGVSNEVLFVSQVDRPEANFVLKQARAQLRTRAPWFCSVERIWREVEVLKICTELLAASGEAACSATTPRVLFEDRENYAFAMTAAPRDHVVWKKQLLAGQLAYKPEAQASESDAMHSLARRACIATDQADLEIAEQCGRLLGTLHRQSWENDDLARRLGDRQLFEELRIDPYYRTVARAFPEFAPHLERLIDSVANHPRCLVHADFSPKNLLVYPGGLMMVDFETGHFGDPAFDLGFFLSHLMLKAFYKAPDHEPYLELTRRFWQAYAATLLGLLSTRLYSHLVQRSIQNFAGCAWARIDGKSKVEYLNDSQRKSAVRELCQEILLQSLSTWDEVLTASRQRLSKL